MKSKKDVTDMMWFAIAIELNDVTNFLLGMLTGFILLGMFIAFILISGKTKKHKSFLPEQPKIDDVTIQRMIEEKQEELNETVKLTDQAYIRVAFDLSFELMNEIARHYYPNSKYPLYELSVQEIIDLNYYITERLEDIFDSKWLRIFKNHRISTVLKLLDKKKAIQNSKLMKATKKYKLKKVFQIGKAVLNYANPIYWFRKLAIKPSTTLVIKEVSKFIIAVFGEETNNIYSKKIFEEDDAEALEEAYDEMIESENPEEEK